MKEDLIAIVHLTPVLWDKSHRNHHNRHVLEREWKRIGTELGKSDKQVRYVWKNLRQEFGKQLRKTLKSGSTSPDEASSWPYFDSLLFLSDQFSFRTSNGNLTSNQDDSSSLIGTEDGKEEKNGDFQNTPVETSFLRSCLSAGNVTNVKKSRNVSTMKTKTGYIKRVTPQTVIDQQLWELEKEKLKLKQNEAAENPNDEDVGFFNSLLPHVRQLTPRDKLCFRMQVQRILFDMSYPPQELASDTQYVAISPQQSTASASTSQPLPDESGHKDATIDIKNTECGNHFMM